jgi:hypothetical protein
VQVIKSNITVKIEKKPKEEVLQLIEEALVEHAEIEIVHELGGDLTAKRLIAKK